MTKLKSAPADLPVGEGQADNLTCFAGAGLPVAESGPKPAKAGVSALPDVLAGRYRLECLLGAGGMGAVYRARDLLSEQFGDPDPHIAVKVLHGEFAESPDASALLFGEFALTRTLRHANIVRVHAFEVDTECQRAFVTMELMQGLTLDKLLCERPLGLPWQELRDIALPLLDALACAHAQGVLHGDIKPGNVMLGDDTVRLFDFGLGQAEEGVLPGLPQLSRHRFNAWTPGYAAPELLAGASMSAAADMFSVACVIYELACGKHPFQRLPLNEARARQMGRALRMPVHLPKRYWPALRTALALEVPARRITVARLREIFHGKPRCWLPRFWYRG